MSSMNRCRKHGIFVGVTKITSDCVGYNRITLRGYRNPSQGLHMELRGTPTLCVVNSVVVFMEL